MAEDIKKYIYLGLLILVVLAVEGHSSRETLTFPVETRKYIIKSRLNIVNPPTSATADGMEGWVAFDTKYAYRCIATNTWKRWEMSTWTDSYWLWPDGSKILWPTGDFIVLP